MKLLLSWSSRQISIGRPYRHILFVFSLLGRCSHFHFSDFFSLKAQETQTVFETSCLTDNWSQRRCALPCFVCHTKGVLAMSNPRLCDLERLTSPPIKTLAASDFLIITKNKPHQSLTRGQTRRSYCRTDAGKDAGCAVMEAVASCQCAAEGNIRRHQHLKESFAKKAETKPHAPLFSYR